MSALPSKLAEPAPPAPPPAALQARARRAYACQSREALEERWILDHLPLVRHIVQKVTAPLAYKGDVDDLISAGTLGLVKAARAFDPTRDSEFKTYAYIRVRGSVLDELRGRSFAPSSVHQQVRRVRQAYESLTAELGGPPDDEQLAARVGLATAELYHVLEEARRQNFLSIHGLSEEHPLLGTFVPADDAPSPQVQVERREVLAELAKAVQELPERDRLVLILYYERDLTMKEAAQVLGVTESRISQVHAAALFKLSMKLGRSAS